MFDGADGAAQFGEALAAGRSRLAGIGALGLGEVVQHAVAVIGPEHDLSPAARRRFSATSAFSTATMSTSPSR